MKTLITSRFTGASLLWLICGLAHAASHYKVEFIHQYDLNQDGALEKDEFNQARRARFDATDSNSNGLVDVKEYIYEYENRLDQKIAEERKAHIKQTGIRFKSLDKNQDWKMVWEEYEASGNRIFSRYDTNKDGQIDASDPKPQPRQVQSDENKKKRQQTQKKWENRVVRISSTHSVEGVYQNYDMDSDKIVTRKEFDLQRRATFRQTDENLDGWISEDEYTLEYEDRLDAEIARARRAQIKQTYVRFEVLDKNKDGTITFKEYQLSGSRSFSRWDTNQDGIVSPEDSLPVSDSRQAKDTNKSTAY